MVCYDGRDKKSAVLTYMRYDADIRKEEPVNKNVLTLLPFLPREIRAPRTTEKTEETADFHTLHTRKQHTYMHTRTYVCLYLYTSLQIPIDAYIQRNEYIQARRGSAGEDSFRFFIPVCWRCSSRRRSSTSIHPHANLFIYLHIPNYLAVCTYLYTQQGQEVQEHIQVRR